MPKNWNHQNSNGNERNWVNSKGDLPKRVRVLSQNSQKLKWKKQRLTPKYSLAAAAWLTAPWYFSWLNPNTSPSTNQEYKNMYTYALCSPHDWIYRKNRKKQALTGKIPLQKKHINHVQTSNETNKRLNSTNERVWCDLKCGLVVVAYGIRCGRGNEKGKAAPPLLNAGAKKLGLYQWRADSRAMRVDRRG